MPTRYSSDHSLRDARELAANLGVLFTFKYLDFFMAAWHGLSTGFSGEGTPGLRRFAALLSRGETICCTSCD